MGAARCRTCGKPIQFVRTVRGKMMPCEDVRVFICETGRKGDRVFLNEDGEIIRGYLTNRDSPAAQSAYEPHFAACRPPAQNQEELAARRAQAEETKQKLIEQMMRERGFS